MKKLLPFFLLILLCVACDSDEDFPTPTPPTDENWIDIKIVDTKTAYGFTEISFYIIADRITIDWGDGNIETLENVWDKGTENMSEDVSQKMISHQYKNSSIKNYNIRLSTEGLKELTATDESISEIEIGECPHLTSLNLENSYKSLTLNYKSKNTPNLKSLYLNGIENITSLELNNCLIIEDLFLWSCPNLTTLDISKNNKLSSINLRNNKLKDLDISNNTELIIFTCTESEISSLDMTNNEILQYIHCEYTNISSLNWTNNNILRHLTLQGNKFTGELDLSNNKSVSSINISNEKITSVDISGCPSLVHASLSNNEINQLLLEDTNEIEILRLDNNQIDKSTLNSIFSNLPTNSEGHIYIANNPGTDECDKSIATTKGWVFK